MMAIRRWIGVDTHLMSLQRRRSAVTDKNVWRTESEKEHSQQQWRAQKTIREHEIPTECCRDSHRFSCSVIPLRVILWNYKFVECGQIPCRRAWVRLAFWGAVSIHSPPRKRVHKIRVFVRVHVNGQCQRSTLIPLGCKSNVRINKFWKIHDGLKRARQCQD